MKSKERLEALNYTWFYEPTCQEDADKREKIIKELEKDLEDYEHLKELMGTPIQDIMKKLKVLEIIKKKNVYMFRINNCINAEEYNEWVGINVDDELNEEEFNLIKGVIRCLVG